MLEVILGLGIAFLILELIIPEVIYFNLAIASIVTAGATFIVSSGIWLTGIFVTSLIASVLIVRPKILTMEKEKETQKKIKAKYLGKIAQVVEKTNKDAGVLTIDNERWQARTTKDETIEEGQNAKITNYKNIIMYVEKV